MPDRKERRRFKPGIKVNYSYVPESGLTAYAVGCPGNENSQPHTFTVYLKTADYRYSNVYTCPSHPAQNNLRRL